MAVTAVSGPGGTIYLNPLLNPSRYTNTKDRYRQQKLDAARRHLRITYLHEMGHALDKEMTDGDRGKFAAIMRLQGKPWNGLPHEQFAEAYAHIAAGQDYTQVFDGPGADYNLNPTRAQYKKLQHLFAQIALRLVPPH